MHANVNNIVITRINNTCINDADVVSNVVLRRTDRGAAGYGCGCGHGGSRNALLFLLKDLLRWMLALMQFPTAGRFSMGLLWLRDLLRWKLALVQFLTAGRLFNEFALVERLAPVEVCSG